MLKLHIENIHINIYMFSIFFQKQISKGLTELQESVYTINKTFCFKDEKIEAQNGLCSEAQS